MHVENLLPSKSSLVNITKEKNFLKLLAYGLMINKNTLHYFYIFKK